MTPIAFVNKYRGFAQSAELATGVPALVILTQAAIESAWGKSAPGNMFFGVKDTDGINGNEQLLTTTEISRRADLKFPVIISITPVTIDGKKYFKYRVKDYFRKYYSPEDSFTDHGLFLKKNKRYKEAFQFVDDPKKFLISIASAGYASDPEYGKKLLQVYSKIINLI